MLASGSKILIVDDEVLIGMLLGQMVSDLGFDVCGPYSNLQDGMDHLGDGLSYALLDFDLGNGTDSIPIVEQLGEMGVPCALVSGTSRMAIAESLPGIEVLSKPVDARALSLILTGHS